MSDKEKVIVYEMQIEDMLNTLNSRLLEFKDIKDLSKFEQGRQCAYIEMMDIIKTRHKMILEALEIEEEIQRLKEESNKLTEWPACNES